MAEPSRKRPRVTPRNSDVTAAEVDNETPYSSLRQLATIIQKPSLSTPQQRAPSSANRQLNRTPGTATRTPRPGTASRPAPVRRGPPTTPHAIRALQQRRNAALTPGRDRRRSGVQRETPRDALRNLSRILARTTHPVEPSPQVKSEASILDDLAGEDEEPDPVPPRLSMPLNDLEDDDSFHEAPPRLSLALDEEENYTVQSIEGGRRALMDRSRLSRGSFGSLRLSERFADVNELGLEDGADEEGEVGGGVGFEGDAVLDGEIYVDEGTQELRSFVNAAARRQSRRSELDMPASPETDAEPTFQFRIMQREREASPPAEAGLDIDDDDEQAAAAGAADDAPDEYEDEVDEAEHEERVYREDSLTLAAANAPTTERQARKPSKKQKRKDLKVSRFGIEYPSLPPSVIKRLATTFARSNGSSGRLDRDTLAAISQASDWFFEQAAEDLGSYAEHAGRKTIDESDVVTLMKRQRQLNANATPFSLAQKYLPRELLQEIRMAPPAKARRKRRRMETIEEEDEE